ESRRRWFSMKPIGRRYAPAWVAVTMAVGCSSVTDNGLSPTGPGGTGAGGGGGAADGCASSKQCTEENAGNPYVCPVPGSACQPLLSEACFEVIGAQPAPTAIFFGALVPASGTLAEDFMHNALRCAQVGVRDSFEGSVVGLPAPNGAPKRPPVYVVCNE